MLTPYLNSESLYALVCVYGRHAFCFLEYSMPDSFVCTLARQAYRLWTCLCLFVQAPSVDRSLKPVVIVAVGDVALSLGGASFSRFAPFLIELLVQAGVTPYDAGPPNWQVGRMIVPSC